MMRDKIEVLFDFVKREDLVDLISKIPQYNDDPKLFQFSSKLKYKKKYSDGFKFDEIICSGKSFFSKELALLKCLSETAERFCQTVYKNESVLYSNFLDIKSSALDPQLFCSDELIRNKKIGWVLGRDLFSGKKCYLPAQLVFLNYRRKKDEPRLGFSNVSTGAAGEFSKEAALLNGILEVVERDAFMNMYLAKIGMKQVNLKSQNNKNLQHILNACDRYNLELFVFDITNDLEIPTYLSLVVDRTGIGPALAVGTKAGFDSISAIIGAIEESIATRGGIRRSMYDSELEKHLEESGEILNRGLLWSSLDYLKNLDFLVKSNKKTLKKLSIGSFGKSEFARVCTILKKKGFGVFYADICPGVLKDLGYFAYKVIIPGLQPLYLEEEGKSAVNLARLAKVAGHFNLKNLKINEIPHPFL